MSSGERYALQRSIRRSEYAHTLVAGLLQIIELSLADQRKALASDEASRAQAIATNAERRNGIAAQRKDPQ
jgi:hypothetical protein